MTARISLDDVRVSDAISKHNLDEDNLEQPQLMFDVSQKHADARADARKAKLNVDEVYAELDREVRLDVEMGKLTKMSETQLKQYIVTHPRMRSAESELLKAEHLADKWAGALESIRSRGSSLQEMGRLYASNYFSREAGGAERSRIKDDRADRARSEAGERRFPSDRPSRPRGHVRGD